MKKQLSPWGKEAQITMIRKDMTLSDVADITGYTKEYVCAVINGKVIRPGPIKKISEALGISEHVESGLAIPK